METQTGLSLAYEALRRVNQIRPPESQVPEDPDVVLLGDKGLLDSMAVTVLIVALENLLREKTGREVSLMESRVWPGYSSVKLNTESAVPTSRNT